MKERRINEGKKNGCGEEERGKRSRRGGERRMKWGGVMLNMSSLPQHLYRVVSISACAQTHPSSIALRYVQRRILMADPNWNNGWYYNRTFPRMGMQHARLAHFVMM